LLHFFTVPETRTTIMMNKIAKKRRKEGNPNIWGPDELVPFKDRFSAKEIMLTWTRPFKMFLTEPIVLVLSLLSGFSDALIFMFIQSFSLVYKQWDFSIVQVGLAFLPIGVGYLLAWLAFIPAIRRNIKERQTNPDDERAQYESRLKFLLWTAPCLPIGLIGFAWTIQGPPIHWIGSMIFAAIVGIANYSIYMATIDYMICAYGPYSASATGGNGWSRDFLAGVLTLPATPFFTNIGKASGKNLEYACTILFCISFLLVTAVYVIYWKGPALRARSPFAQQLASARQEDGGRRPSVIHESRRPSEFDSSLSLSAQELTQSQAKQHTHPVRSDRAPVVGRTVSSSVFSAKNASPPKGRREAHHRQADQTALPTFARLSEGPRFSRLSGLEEVLGLGMALQDCVLDQAAGHTYKCKVKEEEQLYSRSATVSSLLSWHGLLPALHLRRVARRQKPCNVV